MSLLIFFTKKVPILWWMVEDAKLLVKVGPKKKHVWKKFEITKATASP